jgi:hypothetical protein
VDRVRPDEHRLEAAAGHAPDLPHRRDGIVQRHQHAHRLEAVRGVGAEVDDPVVVGPADRSRERGIEIIDGRRVEPLARIEERHLDAALVERLHL